MPEIILETKELVKIYGDAAKTQVLFGVNVKIETGTFTSLIGPSGSGKSTFLNCISLLEPPTGGDILISGRSVAQMSRAEVAGFRNATEGFVFQFHNLLPEFTALENILMPAWISGGRPSVDTRKHALALLERIGILKSKDKYPSQLSGGQQQRVAIARALINRPQLIFADEPTGNLDRESGREVLDLFRQIMREEKTTLIMVTHDREIALTADRVLELVDGRICRSFSIAALGLDESRRLLEDRSCTVQN
ncbi:MAG: ABC transporter ATP-binding protein [Candidatus Firestonebacteria bacterium]|nr:ABC transporter ATP-binding protein [Candidatus Firestonebacteria bacterium]